MNMMNHPYSIRTASVLLGFWLGLFATCLLQAQSSSKPGNDQVDGRKLKPYDLSWHQCSLQEGQWVSRSPLQEKMDLIGEAVIRQRQTTSRPDGGMTVATNYFDRRTFSLLRIETDFFQADGTKAAWVEYSFTDEGYTGRKARGEEVKEVSGSLTTKMLHGAALGLPLASLPWQDAPLTLLSSMVNFDASYEVIATWAGTEPIEVVDGKTVEAWLIDLEWKHREQGDIYAPGPDASGGRFWIIPQPPEGFPYALRYKTDSYAVEFTRKFCPLPVSN